LHRAPGTLRGFFDAAARFISRQQQFAIARRQSLEAFGKSDMAIVQLLHHGASRLRHRVNNVLVEDDFGASKFLRLITDAPIGDLAGPGDEVGSVLETIKFFANDHAGFLQKILSIVAIGNESVNISENLPLMLRHQGQ
jgi:hypothetical protein